MTLYTNTYLWTLAGLSIWLVGCLLGLVWSKKRQDYLLLAVYLGISTVYLVVNPWLHYLRQDLGFMEVPLTPVGLEGVGRMHLFAMVGICVGFLLVKRLLAARQNPVDVWELPENGRGSSGHPLHLGLSYSWRKRIIMVAPVLCLVGMVYDLVNSTGFRLQDVLLPFLADYVPDSTKLNTFPYMPKNPYLEGLGDTLMVFLVWIAIDKTLPNWYRWTIGLYSLVLYTELGWRYRIIVIVLALLLHGLTPYLQRKWQARTWATWLGVAGLAMYAVVFLTMNRWALGHRMYDQIVFAPWKMPVEQFLLETDNGRVDAVLYQHMVKKSIAHDGGATSILGAAYRFVPKSFFPNGQKPLPPVLDTHMQAMDRFDLFGCGAISQPMEFWYGFGNWSVVLMVLFGMLLAQLKTPGLSVNYRVVYFLIGGILMQVISRGYMPQHIELLVFWGVGFTALYWLGEPRKLSNS